MLMEVFFLIKHFLVLFFEKVANPLAPVGLLLAPVRAS